MKKGYPAVGSAAKTQLPSPASVGKRCGMEPSDKRASALSEMPENHADRFQIHVRALNGALTFLETKNVPQSQLNDELERFGFQGVQLRALDDFISLNRFSRFLKRMGQIIDDEAIGLHCAQFINGGSMGVLGGAVATAPNLGASVGALTRYMSLYADLSYISFTVSEDKAQFSWSYSPLLIERAGVCDRGAGLFVGHMQTLFRDGWQPLSVQLQRARPKDLAPFRKVLGADLSFNTPLNVIEFPASDLALVNRYADQSAYELAIALAERMLKERRTPDDLSIRVREDILQNLEERSLTAVDTARRLGMSTRVLQRRLASLGTSYQKLCDSMRIEMAQELLVQTGLPMSEIAFRLGFSNQANLTRAVRRWFGISPREFRRQNRS